MKSIDLAPGNLMCEDDDDDDDDGRMEVLVLVMVMVMGYRGLQVSQLFIYLYF